MIGRMAAALSLILIAATLPAPASTRSGVPTAAAATAATAKPPAADQTHDARAIGAGRFGIAAVYVPEGKPRSVAIFVSGDGGWELGVINMAQAGEIVVDVDADDHRAAGDLRDELIGGERIADLILLTLERDPRLPQG